MPEATSYLSGCKAEITAQFRDAYKSIADAFDQTAPDRLPEIMKKLQKDVWTVAEKRLKESFINGRKAGGDFKGSKFTESKTTDSGAPPNPFE